MPAMLDVQVRRKRFGARDILRNVQLRVQQGEVVSVVGASGCGKSTLLRLIAGLDRDFDGQVLLDGQPVLRPTPQIRFVFQEPRLFPWLSVARNVAFDAHGGSLGQASQDGDPARVASLLDEVGLAGLGAHLPKQLSGGQAQRVAIARGLYMQPRLLLLDEPFSAVDALTRLRLQDLLLRIAQAHGATVLLVTHDIDEAVHLGDRVLVLTADPADPGRIGAELAVTLPRPRDRAHAARSGAIAEVRSALQQAHAL